MPRDCHYQSCGPLVLLSMLARAAKPSSRARPESTTPLPKLVNGRRSSLACRPTSSPPGPGEAFHESGPTSHIVGECQLLPEEGTAG